MAVRLAGGCRVTEMREGQPIEDGTVRIWNQIGRASGAQAISLRVMEFAPGLSSGFRNGDSDEILYVVGNGSPSDETNVRIHIDDTEYGIGGDCGIYIRPQQTFTIDNPNQDSIVVISSRCPDPVAVQFVDPSQPSHSPVNSHHPPFVRLRDRPSQPTADRWYRVLVDDEIGSTQVTQFVGSIPPGRAPDHFHNYEEVLFILKGEGRMWAGETNTSIAEGSCIYLPKGQVHCVENTGAGELRLLGVFYPAGSPSVRYDV
jgi:mannose-6-phosphate isomerase-like protein (cupin superfamily)